MRPRQGALATHRASAGTETAPANPAVSVRTRSPIGEWQGNSAPQRGTGGAQKKIKGLPILSSHHPS
jgi:hypothetical protein